MLGDIISLIRLAADPEMRATLALLKKSVVATDTNWRKQIRTSRAKFRGDETEKVSVFADVLIEEIRATGARDAAVCDFQIVFTELVSNAFRHGCRYSRRCSVRIVCDYCRWFIRLQVTDSGPGYKFDTAKVVLGPAEHGLDLVLRNSSRVEQNRKGNAITAYIPIHPSLNLEAQTRKLAEKDILVLALENERQWHEWRATWDPLRKAIRESPHQLVLIDCRQIRWSSGRVHEMKTMVHEFVGTEQRRIALVIAFSTTAAFDFSNLISSTSQVFFNQDYEHALAWLTEQPTPVLGTAEYRRLTSR